MFQQLQWKGQKTAAWGAEGLPTPWSTGPGLWPRASLLSQRKTLTVKPAQIHVSVKARWGGGQRSHRFPTRSLRDAEFNPTRMLVTQHPPRASCLPHLSRPGQRRPLQDSAHGGLRGGAGWEGRKPEGESWALLQPGGQLGFTPRETPPPPPDQPTWGSQGGKRPETNPDQRRPTQTNPDGAHTVRNKLRPTRISLLGWQMSCRLLPPSLSFFIAG